MTDVLVLKVGGSEWGEPANSGLPANFQTVVSTIGEIARTKTVVPVVSAFKGVTDGLIKQAEILQHSSPSLEARNAQAALIASGETQAATLLGLALNTRIFQGWQVPLLTNGDVEHAVIDLKASGKKLARWLDEGNRTAVVAGFQGVSRRDNIITTFARGGTDYSAIATTIILRDHYTAAGNQVTCHILRSASGVRAADPNLVDKARTHQALSYDELYAISVASGGQQLIQTDAMSLAKNNGVVLSIGPIDSDGSSRSATRVTNESGKENGIIAVACNRIGNRDPRSFIDVSVVGWHLTDETQRTFSELLKGLAQKISRDTIMNVDLRLSAISASVPNTSEAIKKAANILYEGFGCGTA